MYQIAMLDSDALCIKGVREYFKLSAFNTVACASLHDLNNTLLHLNVRIVIAELVNDNDNLFSCIDFFKMFHARRPHVNLVIFTRLRDPALIAYVRKSLPRCKLAFKDEDICKLAACIFPKGTGPEIKEEYQGQYSRDVLTTREFYLLRYLAEGKAHKDISRRLPLSIKTISYYKHQIMSKLRCRNAAEFQKRLSDFGIFYYP